MRIEKLKLEDLNPATYNPRTITEESLKGLENSIKSFDCVELLVVNIANNNTIVSGHQRYQALKNLGITETDCVLVDLDPVKEKALNITMNNKHIAGEWDIEKLEPLLQELSVDFSEFGDVNLDSIVGEFDFNVNIEINEDTSEPKSDVGGKECPKCGYKWNE